jgi:hypothetical protein
MNMCSRENPEIDCAHHGSKAAVSKQKFGLVPVDKPIEAQN